MIPESFIEDLKHRLEIEQVVAPYTSLKRSGRNLTGLCPFHSEKSPSFFIYPESNSFYCFGCGVGGDLVQFVRLAEHLDYVEAVRFLARQAGLAMPEDAHDEVASRQKMRLLELNREAARFFHATLNSPQGAPGLQYLRARGLSDATIRRFGLGFAPERWNTLRDAMQDKGFTLAELSSAALIRMSEKGSFDQFRNRVIFPIIDLRGAVIAFGGRILGDGKPKYLNSADTPVFKKSNGLFALNIAKATRRKQLVLCEGYMDAIAIHQAGFDNAVATLGTSLTPEQARLIARYTAEVVICYDSDEPGQRATERAAALFAQTGIKVRVLTMPDAKDPDEYIKKFGAARFAQLLEQSANATEHEVRRLQARFDLDTDDGKVSFLREFCAMAARLPNPIEADVYINRVAGELGVSREAIGEQVRQLRAKNSKKQEKKFERSLKIFDAEIPGAPRDPQRSANLRYALAEDKLLALMLNNPDYAAQVAAALDPAEFVTDSNRALYALLRERALDGKPMDLMAMGPLLTLVQNNRLSYLLATHRQQTFTMTDAEQLIALLREKGQERTTEQVAAMDKDELEAFIQQLAAKKKQ